MKRTSALLVVMALSACGGGSGDSSHQVSTANSSQAQTSLSVSSSSASTAPTSSSSNSSTSSAPVALENVAVTVGPEGKFISLKQVELDIPANALSAPTTFSLQEQVPNVGELVRVDITPSALAFAVPAEVRFNATNLSAKTALFWQVGSEFWLLPTTVTATGISAKIDNIGYTKTTSAQASLFSRLFKTSAFAAAATPDDELSSANALVALEIDCDTQIDQLSTKIDGARRSGDSSRAIAIKSELVALKSSCSASIHLKTVEVKSCDALAIAIANAQVFSATNFADFFEIETSLMAAQSFVQASQASCPSINMEVVNPLIEQKFTDFLTVLQSKLLNGELIEKAGRRELQTLMSYKAVCEELDLTSACDVLTNRIYPELLDGMRLAALKKCQDNQSRLPLAQFYLIGSQDGSETKFLGYGNFSLAAVEADLHYCTDPSLGLQVFNGAKDSSIELKDRAQTLKPLEALGKYRTKAAVNVPRDGSLKVSGELPGLLCPSGDISQADLVVRIGAHEITRQPLTGSVYALSSQPLKLVVLDALGKTNLDPELTTAFTLDIYREGGKCTDDVKEILMDSFKLFEIEVSVDKTILPERGRLLAGLSYNNSDYSCALSTVGDYQCWGRLPSNSGPWKSSGDYPYIVYKPTSLVGFGSGLKAIAESFYGPCALTQTGDVMCSFDNRTDGTYPLPSVVPGFTKIEKLIPWGYGVCGLDTSKQLWCKEWYAQEVFQVKELPNVMDAVSGNGFLWVKTEGGNLVGLAYYGNGRLERDTAVPDVSDVLSVSYNSFDGSCLIKNSGVVQCTSLNQGGVWQTITDTPMDTVLFARTDPAYFVNPADVPACALTRNGTLSCTGKVEILTQKIEHYSEGCSGGVSEKVELDSLVKAANLQNITDIVITGEGMCAMDDKNAVTCVGDNHHGQLGYKTSYPDPDTSGCPI